MRKSARRPPARRAAATADTATDRVLAHIAARHDRYGRWARALEARFAGATQTTAAERAELSERQVRAWEKAFAARGLGIFPPAVRAAAEVAAAAPSPPAQASGSDPAREAAARPKARRPRRGRETNLPDDPDRLLPADTLATAVRKAIHRNLERMLRHEPGVVAGEDPEEVHDMRVATRRMRSTLAVCRDHLDPRAVRRFAKDLRRLAQRLGAVRDLDVFGLRLAAHRQTLAPAASAELQPLRDAWHARREKARAALLDFLTSERYRNLGEELAAFANTPDSGEPPPLGRDGTPAAHRVADLAPTLIYQRLAAVRAFEDWLPTAARPLPIDGHPAPLARYHALRIAAKRLRYALEAFADALGEGTKSLLADLKALQEHLGDLQDAAVACQLLRDFLVWGHLEPTDAAVPPHPLVAPAVASYLAAEQEVLRRRVAELPTVWPQATGEGFRQRLATLVGNL
jgi:CHAD domain-containing protein